MNPYLISFLAIGLDYGSFKYAEKNISSRYLIKESNPLVSSQEIVKISEAVVVGYALGKLKSKNKKLYYFTVGGLFLANGYLAFHNIREGNK